MTRRKIMVGIIALSLIFLTSGASAATKVFTNNDAFLVFKNALGNRYNDLNVNGKTGKNGSYDYITIQIGTSTIWSHIGTSTNAFANLSWLKAKFLENNNGELSSREKDGIKQAMVNRFNDLCNNSYNSVINRWIGVYNASLVKFNKDRDVAIKICNQTYASSTKDKINFPSSLNKFGILLKSEELKQTRDKCTNDAYTVYFNAVIANRQTIAASSTSEIADASNNLQSCRSSDLITAWTWVR